MVEISKDLIAVQIQNKDFIGIIDRKKRLYTQQIKIPDF